jgi:hypothetical protein
VAIAYRMGTARMHFTTSTKKVCQPHKKEGEPLGRLPPALRSWEDFLVGSTLSSNPPTCLTVRSASCHARCYIAAASTDNFVHADGGHVKAGNDKSCVSWLCKFA